MTGDCHVQFGERLEGKFLRPTQLDFVQKNREPIGLTIDAIRNVLDIWLGEPKRKITERGAKLVYQYQSIGEVPAKLKIEINTTEHFQVLPLRLEPFLVESEWFQGESEIVPNPP